MAKQTLPVDFQDDVLDSSMGGKRRWKLLLQEDGTYILEDVTNYDTVGSTFGASQVNQISQAVNQSADKGDVLGTLSQVKSNSDAKKIASANSLKELAVASNLKTYTTLNQLSLSAPTTVEQIFSAMPDYSYVQIDANNSNAVTNMPINSSGLLEISKNAGGRNFARFTESLSANAANKTMWYGVFSWSGSVAFGGWKKILERDEILATDEEIEANTDPNKIASAVAVKRLNRDLDATKQSFQAGVDTLYNKCSSCGATPSEKTPTAISTAIQTIYNNRYNEGVNAGTAGYWLSTRIAAGDGQSSDVYFPLTRVSSVTISGSTNNQYARIQIYIGSELVYQRNSAYDSHDIPSITRSVSGGTVRVIVEAINNVATSINLVISTS